MREALDIVNGSRQKDYGSPERNFARIATLWSAYLEVAADVQLMAGMHAACRPVISPVNVCHMLDLVKLARLVETPDHEDSLRDRFGYNLCNVDLVYGTGTSTRPREDEIKARGPPSLDDIPNGGSGQLYGGPR